MGKRGKEIFERNADNQMIIVGYTDYWIKPKTLNPGAHLMYDRVLGPVSAPVEQVVHLPPEADLQIFHITAADEHRQDFRLYSVLNKNGIPDRRFDEWRVVGAHSNIGGGQTENGIALETLDAGMRYFGSLGLDLGTLPPE